MSPKTRSTLSLLIVLAATALVWLRATSVLYTADDYQYLHHFAPMRGLGDFFKQFVTADPNAQYWRPLASGLAVIDFLNWGWDGRGFHITNFIIHLLTTGVVFFSAKRLFGLREYYAIAVALLFGISAAHEANILWAAGRTDSLATLFLLIALLCASRADRSERTTLWTGLGVLATLASLCSKEIGFAVIPLVFLLPGSSRSLKQRTLRMLPYLVVGVAFFLYRMPFTAPISSAEVFGGGALHSGRLLIQNAVYAIGYTVLPLDLQQAMSLLSGRGTTLLVVAAIAGLGFLVLAWFVLRGGKWKKYLFPVAFVAITGGLTMLSFERWRVYMMSVGLFAMVISFLVDAFETFRAKSVRWIFPTLLLALTGFHAYRAVSATAEWHDATAELQRLKGDLGNVLASHTDRPVRFLFLDRPAKFGSAPLLQLSIDDVLSQAELERTNSPLLNVGGKTDTLTINSETATLLIATNAERGFEGIECRREADHRDVISSSERSTVLIQPHILKEAGVESRDQGYEQSDTLKAPFANVILDKMEGAYARSVTIEVRDSTLVRLFFDGKHFTILK